MSQTTGLKRNTMDKYYTKKSVVDQCLTHIKNTIDIQRYTVDNTNDKVEVFDLVLEPSAGNGAFIDGIKSLTDNYLFYDLKPQNDEVEQQDYLELDLHKLKTNCEYFIGGNDWTRFHVIGNPPFGRQSSLAIKFIKKSCEFADTISFILPKSFKKDSMKKHFPLNWHLKFEWDIPPNSFLVDDKDYDVPCVFQIWERHHWLREVTKKLEPIGFEFISRDHNPDISVRRIGVNAGKIDDYIADKSIQSHYFIKFIDGYNQETIDALKQITFEEAGNTVGPKSISKQELILKYNLILNK